MGVNGSNSMRFAVIIIALFLVNLELDAQPPVEVIDRNGLEELLETRNDTIYVVNFWASWCSPCVKELPYFNSLSENPPDTRVKVVLVSLDFPDQVERRVLPFLERNDITAPVLIMTELDYNRWIPLVDASWSGAIPATLIFNAGERRFIPTEVTQEELLQAVNEFVH